MKKKPFAWSYSTLSAYETCPAKIRYKRLGYETPPNKYLERGIAVHADGERFLKGETRKFPADYAKFKAPMLRLKQHRAIVEGELAFDRQWRSVGWFDKPVWFRAKIDARYVDPFQDDLMYVIDFKTGRPKPSYQLQDLCYTTAVFAAHAEIQRLTLEFWYLDHGVIVTPPRKIVRRKNVLSGGQKELITRAGRFEREKAWKERPGAHCSFCDYSKRKGGPCKF